MRKVLILVLSLALFTSVAMADSPHAKSYKMRSSGMHFLNNCSIDLDHGSLIIEKKGRRGIKMEINDRYELFVDDIQVETNKEQQKLVVKTYDGTILLVDYAKEIGLEGASIGVEGAKLGLKAVGGVFKMMFTGYDHEDLEEDMERESEKLERRADKLEARADKLEELVEDLEIVYEDLIEKTPALEPLR